MKYYGWIDLNNGGYLAVVKITDDYHAFSYNKKTHEWIQNDDNLSVPFDTTSWDEISEEQTMETIKRISI